MSLADELLADLEDLDDGDEPSLSDLEEEDEEQMDVDTKDAIVTVDSVFEIAKLARGEQLTRVIAEIDAFNENPDQQVTCLGPIEESKDYKLVLEANSLTLEVDNELSVIHQYVRDKYHARFPELQQLVLHPVDYMRTVKIMQNQMDCAKVNLTETLAPATLMIVSVTSSTTQGKPLDDEMLAKVLEACELAMELLEGKTKIFDFVESRMFFLAPNLSNICSANTAAKMMGAAGGLTALSKMPACNILVLGAQKKALSGFSNAAQLPHTGFIYYCDIVQGQPHEYRRKAARLVAAKCALSARVDSYAEERSKGATIGIKDRADIIKKMGKAQEPPPAKVAKALPAPDMNTKKKRGGKRVRKMKERYAMSETRKSSNRMTFAELQEDIFQDEMGHTLGQMGKNTGHFRAPEATKKKGGHLSKKMKAQLAQQQNRGGALSSIRGGDAIAGTSSVAFTPVQGLEINRSMVNKKETKKDDKYFSTNTFAALKQK